MLMDHYSVCGTLLRRHMRRHAHFSEGFDTDDSSDTETCSTVSEEGSDELTTTDPSSTESEGALAARLLPADQELHPWLSAQWLEHVSSTAQRMLLFMVQRGCACSAAWLLQQLQDLGVPAHQVAQVRHARLA